jgi:hemoglobin-like flavoprotein
MTLEEIELVTRSAERVSPRLHELSADFYARLFAAHPELRPLFPADNSGQETKFAASLAAIIEAIPDFAAFSDRTAALGRVHAAHRIGSAQYGVVGAVLLETLAESDPQWDAPTAAAWATAYDLLAESMMLAGRLRT